MILSPRWALGGTGVMQFLFSSVPTAELDIIERDDRGQPPSCSLSRPQVMLLSNSGQIYIGTHTSDIEAAAQHA